MAIITFDTLEYAKNLKNKGFTIEQAEALANENKRVFNEFAETQLATKADLLDVKHELKTELAVVKSVSFALASAVSIKVLFTG